MRDSAISPSCSRWRVQASLARGESQSTSVGHDSRWMTGTGLPHPQFRFAPDADFCGVRCYRLVGSGGCGDSIADTRANALAPAAPSTLRRALRPNPYVQAVTPSTFLFPPNNARNARPCYTGRDAAVRIDRPAHLPHAMLSVTGPAGRGRRKS
jgi:hypothetical protein